MSPTTLYREGTDLDELLAELDGQYPGQVQVLEITHPREGGVLGFFAKQRVGVHYRLADALPETDPFMTALAAARGQAETIPNRIAVPGGGLDVLSDAEVPTGVAAAAAAIVEDVAAGERRISAAQAVADEAVVTARTARPTAGLGPDPATLAAALTGRAVPSVDSTPEPGLVAGADPFASLLASIAVRRPAANLGTRTPAQASRGAAVTDAPSGAPSPAARAAALYDQRSVSQDAPTGHDLSGGSSILGAAPGSARGGYAPADLASTDFAAAGFDILPAPEPDAAPEGSIRHDFAGAAPEAPAAAAIPARPAITLNRGARRAAPSTEPEAEPEADADADAGANERATTTRRRTAPLAWPIAQSTDRTSAETPRLTLRRAADPAAGGATVGDRPAQANAESSRDRGDTMVLSRPPRAQTEPASTSSSAATTPAPPSAGVRQATSLTLRRQLLEIGVPVDRVPGDAVHIYAAIEQLVHALPPAPAAPARPGEILVVVGAARDVVGAAEGVLTAAQTTFEGIWTFACPAASGTRRIPTNGATALTGVEQARTVAADARAAHTGPLLVVIATDTTVGRDKALDVIAAIAPDAVWAAIDATRKPADARLALAPVGRMDGMVVTHAEHSASPATVWELDMPIALVDGRASTPPVWAVLLLDKLGELAREEERACSGVRS